MKVAVLILLLLTGCMNPPKQFTNKRLVLANKQTVRIDELDLSVTNNGCGRKWMTNGEGERPYCDLEVKMQDSVYHFGNSFDPLYIKNLQLKIDKMNPWGREEDSIPPGGCSIIVTRLPDASR